MKLHFKMANVPTKLKGLGCAEMMVNSLNNKAQDKSQAALNVKMWKVSCPQGETTDSGKGGNCPAFRDSEEQQ